MKVDQIKNLLELCVSSRRSGSTTANLEAAKACGGHLVVHDMEDKRRLGGCAIYPNHVNGIKTAPLFFDNGVVIELCKEAVSLNRQKHVLEARSEEYGYYIDEEKARNASLTRQNDEMWYQISKLRARVSELEEFTDSLIKKMDQTGTIV